VFRPFRFNRVKAHFARRYKDFLLLRLPHSLEIKRFGTDQGTKITLFRSRANRFLYNTKNLGVTQFESPDYGSPGKLEKTGGITSKSGNI